MAIFTLLNRAVRTDTTITSPDATAPAGVQTVRLFCDQVANVQAGTTLDMQVDESLDNGASWHLLAGATGMQFNFSDGRPGQPLTQPQLFVNLGEGENAPGRRLRGTLTITGSARFSVVAEVL
jgi:hypothetical protein